MIQKDYLSSLLSFVDQDIARMGVTMNIALDKYHLTVQLPQVLCDLDNHRKSELHIVWTRLILYRHNPSFRSKQNPSF